ncbi:MAG: hypothetical protein COW00_04615 [Bdellovibrio sp. CG12_big_fil_rev_8_21_14_0_65_39_13]|nr:MAG: hypothetical protein COW78_12815 [Bdellovibrio sp. CG22_combo_CG10-13_8_21_14_all_39_27]PIQ61092.1 MAG: hypothetical protein COW00_04615 [Bdellovibrio sp. CG12_big_fil_rev_8_21_14_0_65_39_13]PIR36860.1 MAG: hypothetical protein COV37_01635 [Bdellovibrio sp. CG11_big_fil_rev_8_21_14_0_20_39_38]PJB53987.1 MAG: hypothetical protein CO099_04070 [Bdellovibrio sp. CG_4_9_14_3_um_filter_39_7]
MLLSLFIGLMSQVWSNELVHLSVNELNMTKQDLVLQGTANARKIEVIQDDFEVQIDPELGTPFIADVRLIDNKLMFKNNAIKFAVPLDQGNPLKGLDSISLTDATVNIDQDLITIDSAHLAVEQNQKKVSMLHARLECDPEGRFSTAIDDVCFKKARIQSRDKDRSPTVNMEYQDAISSVKIKMNEMGLSEEVLLADLSSIIGQYKDGVYNLQGAMFKCHRALEMLTPFDLEAFLQNCLVASEIEVNQFHANVSGINTQIDRPKFVLTSDEYQVNSDHLSFKTEEETSNVEELDLNCFKLPVDWTQINHYHLIKGCLVRLDSTVKEIVPTVQSIIIQNGEKVNVSKISDINVQVRNGQMSLTGKIKVWFRLNFKLEAEVSLDEQKGEILFYLKNTRVAGMNAKDLALNLIKKFISGTAIRIDGDKIYITI